MICACMATQSVGNMARVDGGVNTKLYPQVLKEDLMESIEDYRWEAYDVEFQQDNASCHKARSVMSWFEEVGLKVMTWPAQSPDLNPIKHLWTQLKRAIGKGSRPTFLPDLWEAIEREWLNITPETTRSLVESMPRRVAAVLKSRGGYTMY